ncbi:acyl-CoA dehydrogenase family protein [Trinickia mobilis]|uniref:acyl-CoA dehydrogenase family protein n=1 Tax=Trinickia mobilis TaxID=2816356 RepID=UPI001A901681|nr:acyl-CoA dehydrogenase family protein [Trinickia mobilis]
MTFTLLQRSRELMDRHAPGFDAALAGMPFAEREAKPSRCVLRFKESGPIGLLVPTAFGGLGAGAFDALHVQVALGARSPSLAIASAMHQFSIAGMLALVDQGGGAEAHWLRAIAERRLLLSSGFAEGVPGRGILDSGMTASDVSGGVLLSGCKKPCSLVHSTDLLVTSYVSRSDEGEALMVALIPAESDGIVRKPHWQNRVLAGVESDELQLSNVFVPDRMIFSAGRRHRLEPAQVVGFIWFELLVSASYLGACAGLVEQVVERAGWSDSDRVELAMAVQLSLAALEGATRDVEASGPHLDGALARLLLVRYGLEQLVARAADKAHDMLGSTRFMASEESSAWLFATRGLRFAPPARTSMHGRLAAYLNGKAFSMAENGAADTFAPGRNYKPPLPLAGEEWGEGAAGRQWR